MTELIALTLTVGFVIDVAARLAAYRIVRRRQLRRVLAHVGVRR